MVGTEAQNPLHSSSLPNMLQGIWDEVGESNEERIKVHNQIEKECSDVYQRKIDIAAKSMEQLKLKLSARLSAHPPRGNISGTIKEQLEALEQLWEQREKHEKIKDFTVVWSQIHEIHGEINGRSNLKDVPAIDDSDLTLNKFEKYQSDLEQLKKEKSDRLQKVSKFVSTVRDLCDVLGMVNEVDPSMNDPTGVNSQSISDDTLRSLEDKVLELEEKRKKRQDKLQELASQFKKLRILMDGSPMEKEIFDDVASKISIPVNEVIVPGALSWDLIEQVEAEVKRIDREKENMMNDIAFYKQPKLEKIFAKAHIKRDLDAEREKIRALIDSGDVGPATFLEDMENQINEAKKLAFSRKEILNKVEEWMSACEEKSWLEDCQLDVDIDLNLERAKKAQILVNEIPAWVTKLVDDTHAWQRNHGMTFEYHGVPLLDMLNGEWEEEKQRIRTAQILEQSLPQFVPSITSKNLNAKSCLQVKDIPADKLLEVAKKTLDTGRREKYFTLMSLNNVVYCPQFDRLILLAKVVLAENDSVVFLRIAHILRIVIQLIERKEYMSKRGLYYTNKDLFGKKQANSDVALNQVTLLLYCSCNSLPVFTNSRGSIVGDLKYKCKGRDYDCNKTDSFGQSVPIVVDSVTDITSGALFILLVESYSMLSTLYSNNFQKTHNCVIVTAGGTPDMSTKRFLQLISSTLKLPALCLTDGDIYGFQIFLNFKYGTKAMAFDGENLSTPNLHWLGVRPQDTQRYRIPPECIKSLGQKERQRVNKLLKTPYVMQNTKWVEELNFMLAKDQQIDILADESNVSWFAKKFVPAKIIARDWVVSTRRST